VTAFWGSVIEGLIHVPAWQNVDIFISKSTKCGKMPELNNNALKSILSVLLKLPGNWQKKH